MKTEKREDTKLMSLFEQMKEGKNIEEELSKSFEYISNKSLDSLDGSKVQDNINNSLFNNISSKDLQESIERSVLSYKKIPNNVEESSVLEEPELEVVQNHPLSKGTAITHEYEDENKNIIKDTWVIEDVVKQGGFGFTYKAKQGQNGLDILKECYVFGSSRNVKTGNINTAGIGDYKSILHSFQNEPTRIERLMKEKGQEWKRNEMKSYQGILDELKLVIPKSYAFRDGNNKNWYYAMEFVPGHTLSTIMNSFEDDKHSACVLPMSSRLDIMDQVCIAIENLHQIHCVHHDITPNNIMIYFSANNKLQVKVIDYGLAATLVHDDDVITRTRVLEHGTPGFNDLDLNKKDYQDKAKTNPDALKLLDIYALGIILSYLTLVSIQDIKNNKLGQKIRKATIYQPLSLSNEDTVNVCANKLCLNGIKQLVKKATEINLEERMQSVTDFHVSLQKIMQNDARNILDNNLKNLSELSESIKKYGEEVKEKIKTKKHRKMWDDALRIWEDAENKRKNEVLKDVNKTWGSVVECDTNCRESYYKAQQEWKELSEIINRPIDNRSILGLAVVIILLTIFLAIAPMDIIKIPDIGSIPIDTVQNDTIGPKEPIDTVKTEEVTIIDHDSSKVVDKEYLQKIFNDLNSGKINSNDSTVKSIFEINLKVSVQKSQGGNSWSSDINELLAKLEQKYFKINNIKHFSLNPKTGKINSLSVERN